MNRWTYVSIGLAVLVVILGFTTGYFYMQYQSYLSSYQSVSKPATPLFTVAGQASAIISNGHPAVLRVGNLIAIVPSGTEAETPQGNLTTFNFTLVLFSVSNIASPPNSTLKPLFAYAFEVNGQISPNISFINNSTGKPQPIISIVYAPNTWTSWTWLGGTFNGTAYVGGKYAFANSWIYGIM